MSNEPQVEYHDLHGTGSVLCQVFHVEPCGPYDYWPAVTDIPCPVEGCNQHVLWYEAGYVPGYRVCMRPNDDGTFDESTIRHRFLANGNANDPTLILDD
jgi:hypothetical protein